MTERAAIGFWKTVSLLLKLTRRRAVGRMERQQQLLNNRSGRSATNWGSLGTLISIIFMAFLQGFAAFAVIFAVEVSQLHDAEKDGKIVVSSSFLSGVQSLEAARGEEIDTAKASLEEDYRDEAERIVGEEVRRLQEGWKALGAVPTIRALRERFSAVAQAEEIGRAHV